MPQFYLQYPPLPNATTQSFIDDSGITPTGNMMSDFHAALVEVLVTGGALDNRAAGEAYSQDDLWRLYIETFISQDTDGEVDNPSQRGKKAGQSPGHYYKEDKRNDQSKKFKTQLLVPVIPEATSFLAHGQVESATLGFNKFNGLWVDPQGRYIVGHDTADNVYYQWYMDTPGDITTITSTGGKSLAEADTGLCVHVKIYNEGTQMCMQHGANLYFGTMSTPHDITTWSADTGSPWNTGSYTLCDIAHDGSVVWIRNGNAYYQYDLLTPFDLSDRGSADGFYFITDLTTGSHQSVTFYNDGLNAMIAKQWVEMTTPYDITTATMRGEWFLDDTSGWYLTGDTDFIQPDRVNGGLYIFQATGADLHQWIWPTEDGNLSEWSTTAESTASNFTTSPYSLCWSPTGNYLFYHNGLSNLLQRKTASTPFDASTLGAVDNQIAEPASTPTTANMQISADGRNIMVLYTGGFLRASFLGTAWDLSTAGAWVSGACNCSGGGVVDKSGTHLFTASVGAGSQTLYQYKMTDPYDPSTLALVTSLDISSIITTTGQPDSVAMNGDGTKLYVVDGSDDGTVHWWTMSNYDLSTATYAGSQQFSHSLTSPTTIYYDQYAEDGSTLTIMSSTSQDMWVHSRVGG